MLTLTDLFCGAGGSSTGAIAVPGVSVRIASNHWDLAVETHNTNHPDADHLCADLSQIDPRRFPRTDILWASPECTNHSVAKGRKRADSQPDLFGEVLPDAAAERSRATMWEPAFRPAAEIIDWSHLGQRIGDRDKPLADKTIARIRAGIERYWAPVLVPTEGRDGKKAIPVDQPARTMTTRNETGMAFLTVMRGQSGNHPVDHPVSTVSAGGVHHGLCQPFIAELRGGGSVARPVGDPLATVTASGNHHGLVTTYYGHGSTKPTDQALSTLTSTDRHALLMRHHTARGDQGQMSTPVTEPARTVMANGPTPALLAGGPTVDVDDVLFRMLEPREQKLAMDFPRDYVMKGNKREQSRLAGNAVCPPNARDLIGVVAESLGVVA